MQKLQDLIKSRAGLYAPVKTIKYKEMLLRAQTPATPLEQHKQRVQQRERVQQNALLSIRIPALVTSSFTFFQVEALMTAEPNLMNLRTLLLPEPLMKSLTSGSLLKV